MSDPFWLDLMWRALHAPLGLVITTDLPDIVRSRCGTIKQHHMPDFNAISIIRTADGRIWLLNREGKPDEAT